MADDKEKNGTQTVIIKQGKQTPPPTPPKGDEEKS